MGYSRALEQAGATVHNMQRFGSWQGDWIAHVTLPDGRTGYIWGYYGSCSGCDAFEAEFGYENHTCDGGTEYGEKIPGCTQCAEYDRRLAEFGARYFDDLRTADELREKIIDEDWHDDELETYIVSL